MNKLKKARILLCLVFFSLCIISCSSIDDMRGKVASDNNISSEDININNSNIIEQLEKVTVEYVIDGDTFVLEDGTKVRLIGVNTPESTNKVEEYGKESSNYTKEVLTGTTIYLQKDVSDKDKYDRDLRIVWLEVPSSLTDIEEIKDKMFNAHLLINGYAQPYTFEPDITYSEIFKELATAARDTKKGLWSISGSGTTRGDDLG